MNGLFTALESDVPIVTLGFDNSPQARLKSVSIVQNTSYRGASRPMPLSDTTTSILSGFESDVTYGNVSLAHFLFKPILYRMDGIANRLG